MRVERYIWQTVMRNESKRMCWPACKRASADFSSEPLSHLQVHYSGVDRCTSHRLVTDQNESEHTCWDPKDGELCLGRVKSEETLMEARSDTDVQIVRPTWV